MPDLPVREGPRPAASTQLPHSQLDQQPDDNAFTAGAFEAVRDSLPGLSEAPSQISVEGARALVLVDSVAAGPADAFLVGREFAHMHAGGDHSLHLTLPANLAWEAERAGWAEPHYLVRTGQLPPTVVMVYAPRDEPEREVVTTLLRASYAYATS